MQVKSVVLKYFPGLGDPYLNRAAVLFNRIVFQAVHSIISTYVSLCRYALMETMWSEDSMKRPSFTNILKSLNSILLLDDVPVNEEGSIISDSDETTSPYVSVIA